MSECCNEDKKLDFTDGVTQKEAGFVVLVAAFAITLAFAFYKAVVDGDFPVNVTAFLTTLALTIGAVEAVPKVFRGGKR